MHMWTNNITALTCLIAGLVPLGQHYSADGVFSILLLY